MDGIVIILLTLVLWIKYNQQGRDPAPKEEAASPKAQINRNPTLNPEMIHDEHAFMRIAYELGFR